MPARVIESEEMPHKNPRTLPNPYKKVSEYEQEILPSHIQEGLLSVTSESMCTNYWLTACSSLPRKKCG